MTAAASQSPEPYEVPEGGLGSFLTATVGDWSDEALNADNYYDIVKPTADQLAEFGREEDDRIAHVATGETIIPMAVFKEDPALKEALFNRMMDMGIDPERYIVGNELNSINPVTGQPEFFLKKIFKGIKKAVKGVVKVFKKIAPIVLSIGLSMIPVIGPILGTALGSGIGTLIQGGDLKDALKAAAIGGITAGVTSGISNVVKAAVPGGSPGGTFMEGVKGGLPGGGPSAVSSAGADAVSDAVSGTPPVTAAEAVAAAKAQGAGAVIDPNFGAGPAPAGYDPAGMLASNVKDQAGLDAIRGAPVEQVAAASASAPAPAPAPVGIEQVLKENLTPQTSLASYRSDAGIIGAPGPGYAGGPPLPADQSGTLVGVDPKSFVDATGAVTGVGQRAVTLGMDQRGFSQAMKDFITTGDIGSLKQAFIPDRITADRINTFMQESGHQNFQATAGTNLADALTQAKVNPGLMRRFAPFLAAGYIGGEATGLFDAPEEEPVDDMYGGLTGMDLLAQNPLKYRTYAQAGSGYNPPPVGVAGGGSMDTRSFPRRDGAISGPGTETSDDIPAMLSDGEFVMTARAVRGAGNGSREVGMRKMYNMMSQFERTV